jgi:hypothetical protein
LQRQRVIEGVRMSIHVSQVTEVPAGQDPLAPRAYVVGASKERLATIRERLRREGFDVCGHCDRPREFAPPRDTGFMLLITDMGCHATLQKAREYCRLTGTPCVGGVWRSWSTTRERISTLARPQRRDACAGCARACCARRSNAAPNGVRS